MNSRSIDINQYKYNLPDDKIAKYPLRKRDQSKLLMYENGTISDRFFYELPDLLPDDVHLFFNNTRVLYARLPFRKPTGAHIEIFCLEPAYPADYALNLQSKSTCRWNCLVGNLKKWKTGSLFLENDKTFGLKADIITRHAEHVEIEFSWEAPVTFAEILQKAGDVPIPPYLNRESETEDKITYQTLYSRIEGSVAAPTAGLHFTPAVLDALKARGISCHEVTLHVGAGTFRPVINNNVGGHEMHQEYFYAERAVIETLMTKPGGIYAVGTTTVRTLESLYWIGLQLLEQMPGGEKHFFVDQWEPYQHKDEKPVKEALQAIITYMQHTGIDYVTGKTKIIIVPGYTHKIVNGLITNFHQPGSTLLLLLASFVGNDWKKMYEHALKNDYRFLSYGDSCLIKNR